MTLAVDIELTLGEFRLAAAFVSDGRATALFGPSGAGKTSIANAVAGLLRPARGRIVLAGQPLFDSAAGVFVPPHRRRIGYVFQEGRLFPHLTVRQNLLYGAWFNRAPRRLDQVVDLLGIGQLLRRRPHDLSGGEKQRVAIGRALLAAPRLLVMDEPLASLDEARRQEILPYLQRLRDQGVPLLYISHAADEVRRMADTVLRLDQGRVVAAGPPEMVL